MAAGQMVDTLISGNLERFWKSGLFWRREPTLCLHRKMKMERMVSNTSLLTMKSKAPHTRKRTADRYLNSGRRRLDWQQSLTHFVLPTLFLGGAMVGLWGVVQHSLGRDANFRSLEEMEQLAAIMLGLFVIFRSLQLTRLRLQKLGGAVDETEFMDAVKAASQEQGWSYAVLAPGLVRAWTLSEAFPFWGEEIIILRNEEGVWFNSIADPDLHPVITSWGANRAHRKAMEKALRAIEGQAI